MTTEALKARLWTVGELFDEGDTRYTIPIYQRNYAWGAEQIEQLVSDIRDAMRDGDENYFLGNLVVTERDSKAVDYEVIDGQQRLTTLYLLLTYLQICGQAVTDSHRHRLRYQSRTRSTDALRRISTKRSTHEVPGADSGHDEDQAILQGFNIIRQFMVQRMRQSDERSQFADYLQKHVTVVRAVLPKSTDLNRYFEIMNTRGQQLEQVDIVKARLMALIGIGAEQTCFAWIWEACADMDSYVQMSLTRKDTESRKVLFGDDWAWLRVSSFDELLAAHHHLVNKSKEANTLESGNSLTLDEALKKYATAGFVAASEDLENVRFRSTIDFPSFLLHVLKVWQEDDSSEEGGLDDKKLIKRFDALFSRGTTEESILRTRVHDFLLLLLRCRNYFDAYVLKRQFTAGNGDDGDWSLQRLVKGSVTAGSKTASPRYINTATSAAVEAEDDGEVDRGTNDLLLIESMLRVTYTSPRAMHWITMVLRTVITHGPENGLVPLRDRLRNYAREQVRNQLSASGEPARGFDIGRIVFTYVDYLLAIEAPNVDFRFVFRNSIEHFYPQDPDPELQLAYGTLGDPSDRELFGNLALVTVRDNSKFTNLPPFMKAQSVSIVAQSPKLGEMAEIAQADKRAWNSAAITAHHAAMVDVLRRDLGVF